MHKLNLARKFNALIVFLPHEMGHCTGFGSWFCPSSASIIVPQKGEQLYGNADQYFGFWLQSQ
jgi:hypothetical protein